MNIRLGGSQLVSLLAFFAVAAIITYLRFANIRGLVLPLWVDSVHHSALARLIMQQGTVPDSYRPYADVDGIYYHLGYHVVVALIAALTRADVEHVMLIFGQLLSILASLSLYLLTARLSGYSVAGLTAMTISGTLSLMPAYYVTWGRYTQLMGLAILPLAMLMVRAAISKGGRANIAYAGLISACLFFVHYRVTIFLGTYILAYLLCATLRFAFERRSILPLFRNTALLAAVTLVVAVPWLSRLAAEFIFPLDTLLARLVGSPEFNSVPWDLVLDKLVPLLYVLAALGAIAGIARRQLDVVAILLWLVLTVVVVNPTFLGLSPSWVVNNFSLVISQYVPLSILGGFAISDVLIVLESWFTPRGRQWLNIAASIGLVIIASASAVNMTNIVNPVTVLATADDIDALAWIRKATPASAVFLVNERLWQAKTYVGTDGGYWIPNLTGRRTTMPIVFYSQGSPDYITQVNDLAQKIAASPDPNNLDFLAMLSARAVTYVYFGSKGGPLSIEAFERSPHFHVVYSNATVIILEADLQSRVIQNLHRVSLENN